MTIQRDIPLMETAYIDFALGPIPRGLPIESFIRTCVIRVSNHLFNQDTALMKFAIACYLLPTNRLFTGDLLIDYNIIPALNISEAFNYVRNLGITPDDAGLFNDGKMNFALKLSGLKKIAPHEAKLKLLLDHVEWVFSAYEIYKAKP